MTPQRITQSLATTLTVAATLTLAGCGGGSDVLGNPATIRNPEVVGGQYLSFAYFQKCINPIFLAQLPVQIGGTTSTNTCAGSGCHDTHAGTGGALRVFPAAQPLDLSDPANTPAVVRASDMYKNFYSAQAAVVIGSTAQSRLMSKPLLRGVLHGGGLIFLSEDDPNARLIKYWISRPVPVGHDELSTASYSMFTPPDPKSGTCNTQ
ncbi:MAG: hypothetical protein Q7T69_12425 [Rhodoferax sp.]|nr:hypothetical protein [Rhodoferax sp.]